MSAARLSASRRSNKKHPHGGDLALLATHSEPANVEDEIAQDASTPIVVRVRVRAGRHVDGVQLVFLHGDTQRYGSRDGGEEQPAFELSMADREYIVRVNGRQKKHLDGIQFVTNLGRESQWFGGSGGEPFQLTAAAGAMICGLQFDPDVDFCPPLRAIEETAALPRPPQIGILHLLMHKHVRQLVFNGSAAHPSLWTHSVRGSPSVLWLMLRRRAILARLMLRGKPCVARLLLDGEQQRSAPSSLLRRLCTPGDDGAPSVMARMNARDKGDPLRKHSLLQLALGGGPGASASHCVARQLFGKRGAAQTPLARSIFEGDSVNGFASVMQLLTLQPPLLQGFEEAPSAAEAMVTGEGDPDAPPSLMRLMLTGSPSVMDVLLDGERRGKPSLMRRFLEDKSGRGRSLARVVMSPILTAKGARPPLSVYVVPILQLMLAGEAKTPPQESVMRLLCYVPPQPSLLSRSASAGVNTAASAEAAEARRAAERLASSAEAAQAQSPAPRLSRARSSSGLGGSGRGGSLRGIRLPGAEQRAERRARRRAARQRRSLMDLLTAGTPSLTDLFFAGELDGEESLARLMFGTTVEVRNGVLRLGAPIRSQRDAGLMHLLLAGEEPGGPGISFFRLLLVGEKDSGMSVLRLLLLGEGERDEEGDGSVLRGLTAALKAALAAARTRPSHVRNGELKAQLGKVAAAVTGAQKQRTRPEAGSTAGRVAQRLREGLEDVVDALSPQASQFSSVVAALSTISRRNREFQDVWRAQFRLVAREIELAGQRAAPGTTWNRMAPRWKRLAELVADQDWPRFVSEVAQLAGTLDGVRQFTARIDKVASATPRWLRVPTPKKSRNKKDESSSDEDDNE